MSYLSKAQILSRPIQEGREIAKSMHIKTASSKHHIFLSHSHHDVELVENMAALLGDHAQSLYVDWKDASMPEITSPATATAIKTKIIDCKKFMLLATVQALASRWVPWELGIADLSDGMKNICIIPVLDPGRAWSGNEYIGIYSRVEIDTSKGLSVFEPGKNNGGISLSTWLTRL